MKNIRIKVCPFCGDRVRMVEVDEIHYKFICDGCMTETSVTAPMVYDGKATFKELAIESWNQRYLESTILELLSYSYGEE